jgi:hypothetical protein
VASIDENGPKTGLFTDVKLNIINILDCLAGAGEFEPSIAYSENGFSCDLSYTKQRYLDSLARRGIPEFSLWNLSWKGDFQPSRQRNRSYFIPSEADFRLSLMALGCRNRPKTGPFPEIKLDKINNLYYTAGGGEFEPSIAYPENGFLNETCQTKQR